MSRLPLFLVGLSALLGTGIVHGLWTDRWQPSEELAAACEKLDGLSDELAGWRAEAYDPDNDELELAGARSHWSRIFTDAASGEKVMVILMCGKPKQMSVHRPEHCYRAAGYNMSSPPQRLQINVSAAPRAAFWAGVFSRDEEQGPERLRILWSWRAPGVEQARWEAPENPRTAFGHYRVLYKLYLIRVMGSDVSTVEDPSVKLLDQLLPVLDAALNRGQPSP